MTRKVNTLICAAEQEHTPSLPTAHPPFQTKLKKGNNGIRGDGRKKPKTKNVARQPTEKKGKENMGRKKVRRHSSDSLYASDSCSRVRFVFILPLFPGWTPTFPSALLCAWAAQLRIWSRAPPNVWPRFSVCGPGFAQIRRSARVRSVRRPIMSPHPIRCARLTRPCRCSALPEGICSRLLAAYSFVNCHRFCCVSFFSFSQRWPSVWPVSLSPRSR